MSFFGVNVNPFSSAVGQKIDQATDVSLAGENWALNMEICDIINESEDGPRDAIKAIKRKLNQAAGKNYTVVMYTLTVLETCVKNCGKRFHVLACSREFIQELVKLIGPKNEPPTAVQEKVLSLIQTWAETFKQQPYTLGVVQVYQELKAKGIEFPVTDLDAMAPIITPERSVPEVDFSQLGNEMLDGNNSAMQIRNESDTIRSASGPITLNDQQMSKLRSELDIVQGNMRVLSEMLTAQSSESQPGTSETAMNEDLELLSELYNTCKAMQERIVDLIGKLDLDDLTAELLHINDEMNNLFLRYMRFTKNSTALTPSALVAQAIGPGDKQKLGANDSLIDLSDDEAGAAAASSDMLERRIGDLSLSGSRHSRAKKGTNDAEKDEFEAFAQSRTTSSDADKNKGDKDPKNTQSDKTVTSSEFERFLAERTAVAPVDVSKPTASANEPPNSQRQIKKDQEEKSLLAL